MLHYILKTFAHEIGMQTTAPKTHPILLRHTNLKRRALSLAMTLVTAVFGVLCIHPTTWAHGLDPDRAILQLNGTTANLTAILPTAAFSPCKRAGKRSTPEETRTCRVQVLAEVDAVFALTDQQGRAGERFFSDVNAAHLHASEKSADTYLRFTLRYRWNEPPKSLTTHYTHNSKYPLVITATHTTSEETTPTILVMLDAQHSKQTLWGSHTHTAQADHASEHPHEHHSTPVSLLVLAAAGLLAFLGFGAMLTSTFNPNSTSTETGSTH